MIREPVHGAWVETAGRPQAPKPVTTVIRRTSATSCLCTRSVSPCSTIPSPTARQATLGRPRREAESAYGTGSATRLLLGADTNSCVRYGERPGSPHRSPGLPFADSLPPRNGCRIVGWTDFWESAGLRIKIAALPAAALLSWVFCITRIRLLGQGRVGPILSRRAPAPLSCSYGSTHPPPPQTRARLFAMLPTYHALYPKSSPRAIISMRLMCLTPSLPSGSGSRVSR